LFERFAAADAKTLVRPSVPASVYDELRRRFETEVDVLADQNA
jgi:hypothetical protein